jgi:hypothetical protein
MDGARLNHFSALSPPPPPPRPCLRAASSAAAAARISLSVRTPPCIASGRSLLMAEWPARCGRERTWAVASPHAADTTRKTRRRDGSPFHHAVALVEGGGRELVPGVPPAPKRHSRKASRTRRPPHQPRVKRVACTIAAVRRRTRARHAHVRSITRSRASRGPLPRGFTCHGAWRSRARTFDRVARLGSELTFRSACALRRCAR